MKWSIYILIIISIFLIGCTKDKIVFGEIKNTNTIISLWDYPFILTQSEGNIQFLNYFDDNEKIELIMIMDIKKEYVNEIISDKITMFNSLYQEHEVSYSGQYTRYIECPDKFKAKYYERVTKDGKLNYFAYYSNSNYQAGACSEDLINFKSAYVLLYCDIKNTIFEIKYYGDLNSNINKFISKLNC
jgi:hypothetical protein